MHETTFAIVEAIRSIPAGRVSTYGAVAMRAGVAGGASGARQVARVLSSMSERHNLPWWRVVRKNGSIALPRGGGFELQKSLLKSEGVEAGPDGRVDLAHYFDRGDTP